MRISVSAICALCCAGMLAQEPGHRPKPGGGGPLDILRRAVRSQNNLRYYGERSVELMVNGERRVLTEYVLRDGPRSRTTYPDNSFRKGFVVLETPEGRWEFNPIKNEIRQSRPHRQEAMQLMGGLLKAGQEHKLRVEPFDGGQIAGRKTIGVAISDPQGNVARRLWVDAETGLILKAEQFGRVGQKLATWEFKRVNYDPIIRPGDFGPIHREGAKVVNDEPDFNVAWTVLTPTWLPPGFNETGRGLRKFQDRPVVMLHYSDGRRHFTIFQAQGRTAPELPPREAKPGLNVKMARSGDIWSVAMGGVDAETLDRVVQSIGRR